jgi:alpha-tubulin suppressor-like RCC1 family protein
VTSIAAGPLYTCATLADGTVWCWGMNADGELGDGTIVDRSVPVRVTGIDDAVEVAAAKQRACARRRDGTVACWGVIAPSSTALKATAIPATEIAQVAGPCMRTTAGTASCLSGAGQVVPITDATEVVDVAAQDGSGCVVRRNGGVACWWSPEYVAHPIAKLTGAKRVAIADHVACALLETGAATCWDWGWRPPPMPTMAPPRNPPPPRPPERLPVRAARIANVAGALTITGGDGRFCVTTKRDVQCWTDTRTATPIKGLGKVVALAIASHTCAWRGGRDIACLGHDNYGQLGNGWSDARTIPTPIPNLTDVVEIGTAFSSGTAAQWSCARRRDDHLWCWGNTSPHNTPGGDPTPRERAHLGAIKHITRGMIAGVIDTKDRWRFAPKDDAIFKLPPVASADGDCALAIDGRVLCTSEHRDGNVTPTGDGYAIAGIDDAVQIAIGGNPACARRRGGQVVCFEQRALTVIKAIPDAIDLAAGTFATCAVRADHHVWCWGQNGSWVLKGNPLHQAGDSPPIEIPNLTDVTVISLGSDYGCALRTDKTVWCWGDNRFGQLGDGTVTARTKPARVPGLGKVLQISAGTQHACALLEDHTVTCWGESSSGQIGTFATNMIEQPTAVVW